MDLSLNNKKNCYKTVVLGETSVGKSSIGSQFTLGNFSNFQEPTIGAAFLKGAVDLNDVKINFEIWDTAGQERYHCLAPMYYRNAIFAVIVYDVTDHDTFSKAKQWVNEIKMRSNCEYIIIVGNKIDLINHRKVSQDEADKYAKDNNLLFLETSAKTGYNINKIFTMLAENYQQKNKNKKEDNKVLLNLTPKKKRRNYFC